MRKATSNPAMDPLTLTPLVRRLLNREVSLVQSWEIRLLSSGGNPVSGGIFEVSGSAEERGESLDWSLILKIVRPPIESGVSHVVGGLHPEHWNYWRREDLFYRSALVDSFPPTLTAPRCLGIQEGPGGSVRIWLEPAAGRGYNEWTLRDYESVARHLGRFNGRYMSERPLPSFEWLSRSLLRQWCEQLTTNEGNSSFSRNSTTAWIHILEKPIFATDRANGFITLLNQRERVLSALDRLPQTLCHRDASPENMFVFVDRHGHDRTMAIDWALIGVGSVGEELAPLAAGAVQHLVKLEMAEISDAIFEAYLVGLRASDWQGDTLDVRFGFAAATALRAGLWMIWSLSRVIQSERSSKTDKTEGEILADAIESSGRVVHLVFSLAAEALSF